ncbi:hypothetical protein [Almyronema epifaneia]|uniref:Peptidase M15 n=1 Tax=Almyronema epifaneia S1 TaxID=2991925 RepID=A0ABW6IBJ0_9CYAN
MTTSPKCGKYLTLQNFCTCTQTYAHFPDQIAPYPVQPQTLTAIADLCSHILDPIIDNFGEARFNLTYGFCSADLKRFLHQKDPLTHQKRGRIDPSRDQHMSYELNRCGRLYCDRGGAACDFKILDLSSDRLVVWILDRALPFDSLYFYGCDRPIHISYGPQHKRAIWAFTDKGTPTRQGIGYWVEKAAGIR